MARINSGPLRASGADRRRLGVSRDVSVRLIGFVTHAKRNRGPETRPRTKRASSGAAFSATMRPHAPLRESYRSISDVIERRSTQKGRPLPLSNRAQRSSNSVTLFSLARPRRGHQILASAAPGNSATRTAFLCAPARSFGGRYVLCTCRMCVWTTSLLR